MLTRSGLAIVCCAIALVAGSAARAQQASKSDARSELTRLLTQRRDTLQMRVELLEQRLAQSEATIDSVVTARNQLLDANLQLATTKKQRLEILRKRIDNMRELEDAMKQRHEDGKTTMVSVLAVTAGRLQAEIDLAREKQ